MIDCIYLLFAMLIGSCALKDDKWACYIDIYMAVFIAANM